MSDAKSQPPIVKFAGSQILYVRGSSGEYFATDSTMILKDLQAHHPDLDVFTDGGKPKGTERLFRDFGRRGDRLVYSMVNGTGFQAGNDMGGTLTIRCAAEDPRVRPVFDRDVDKWLRVLGGAQQHRLLDWCAAVHDLAQPTCALFLDGPAGSGKGLLAAIAAQRYGAAVSSYDDVLGSNFNSALRDCPIVFLDEGVPRRHGGSAAFRSLISEGRRPLTEKHRPTATILGYPRLIIAANNPDALGLSDEQLTADDERAIAQRILRIEIRDLAARHLRELGGREYTADWVTDSCGGPGRAVNHFRWLQDSHPFKPGPRFLVEGDPDSWWDRLSGADTTEAKVLRAVAEAHARRVPLGPDTLGPFVAVEVQALRARWTELEGGAVPGHTQLGKALTKLAGKPESRRTPNGRTRVYLLPLDRVSAIADAEGIGEPAPIPGAGGTCQGTGTLNQENSPTSA